MVYIIPRKFKKFYDTWNVQTFILFSLSLQTILILCAPSRKRTGNVIVIWLIWSAYLLADWAANFAVGLISNRQDDTPGKGPDDRYDILAFWAPFLLLHLGGPDTITAFALEDNALWLRHFVGLATQVAAAFIVFGQSLPTNKLWVPTVLLFIAGTIKYGERTRALYLANLNKFRESMLKPPDPGPNYAKLMEEYASKKDAKLPTHMEMIGEPNKESKAALFAEDVGNLKDDVVVVGHAYRFFNIFKGLIVDLIFSFRERHDSRLFFQNRESEDAFKVIAVELNFIYEVLYTKVVVVHSILGFVVRFISWIVVVAALLTFYSIDKKGFHKIDVRITYTLLFGAIGLDTIALFMLIFSDWTVASVKKSMEISFIRPIAKFVCIPLRYYLSFKRINWPPQEPQRSSETTESINCLEWVRRILFRRWSEYLYTYDFIEYCLKERPKTTSLNVFDYLCYFLICVIETFGLKDFYDRMRYVSKKPCTRELWNFIFEQLKEKSKLADDPETAKRICAARGDWILQDSEWNSGSTKLMSYVVDFDYDQSLMSWHIATELCYTRDPNNPPDGSREISKTLSDYMLYLLVMQPTMMSAVAGIGQIRFRDTCAEAKKFFSSRDLKGPKEEHEEACERLLGINTDVPPVAVKGDRSKSVLFDACILAKELENLYKDKPENKWKLMSEVWVELLSYAAGHCRANTHAAQLSKGGELITFVWLLMAHLGIGEQFQINEGHARAKLIVGK
ncbi:uncharacterized protein LOC111996904 [Quercus suber]|uniref:DUF4220 domain-containing protein n=1 Tax=Quercus suber TaxID=58331 RepID=A0AAW0JF00_QUESU|nr:uncharacterized protein LOC111996904 [Quercus suber]POE70292.1 hypothetical protein CFP56_49636 [Quercus suber]